MEHSHSAILAYIRDRNSHLRAPLVPGLTLNFEYLRGIGAKQNFLHDWSAGRKLGSSPAIHREFRNHPSLNQNSTWADAEWNRLELLGKVSFFPRGEPRPTRLNASPCALLLKPREGADPEDDIQNRFKARLILDLRRGMVNPRMPDVGVNYGTVDRAVSMLRQNDWIFVVDMQDCFFFNWRVHPDDCWQLGFYSGSRQQYGKYNFLPFGLKVAPGVNDESMKEILRLLHQECKISLVDFVDDLFEAGHSLEQSWDRLWAVVRFLSDCGLPVSAKPTGIRTPSQVQTWIGWVFDTVRCVVTITKAKCRKCQQACEQVLNADSHRLLRAHALAATAGLVSHVAEIYPQARRRLHPLWSDLNAAGVYAAWAHGFS